MAKRIIRRRIYKKKRPIRRRKVFRKRKNMASKNQIKYFVPGQLPLPPRYVTKIECDVNGYWNSGSGSSGRFSVKLNSFELPFMTPNAITNATPPVATTYPTGLRLLLNNTCYQNYRIFASKISFRILPGNLLDQIGCVVIPRTEDGTTAGSYDVALSQPFARNKNFNPVMDTKPIVNRISVAKLLGVRPMAVKDDVSGSLTGGIVTNIPVDPNSLLFWDIYFKDINGAVLSNNLGLICKVTYYVELFTLENQQLPES